MPFGSTRLDLPRLNCGGFSSLATTGYLRTMAGPSFPKVYTSPLSVCVSVSVCTSVRVCAAVCCCSPGNGKWKHPAQFASLGDAIEVWGWLGTKDKDPNIPRNVEHCQKNMSLMLFTRKGLGSRTTTWYEEVATATFWKYLQIYVCNFYFLPFFGLSISKDFYILN